jgi:hypothetical protein
MGQDQIAHMRSVEWDGQVPDEVERRTNPRRTQTEIDFERKTEELCFPYLMIALQLGE